MGHKSHLGRSNVLDVLDVVHFDFFILSPGASDLQPRIPVPLWSILRHKDRGPTDRIDSALGTGSLRRSLSTFIGCFSQPQQTMAAQTGDVLAAHLEGFMASSEAC